MKRLAAALLAVSCSSSDKAPPSVPTVGMPTGDALKPFDPAMPSLARPAGIAVFNGKAYVALGNYDANYTVRGPGLLAVLPPTPGPPPVIDRGGAGGRQCLQ